MDENILLIIKEKEDPKPHIKLAPGVLSATNNILDKKPISPVIGKKIILKPKPSPIVKSFKRRTKMGMMFL